MADARITIDADAGQVVVEAGKAKRAIASLGAQTERSSRRGAALSAAGAKQVETMTSLGRAARNATLAISALGAAGAAKAIKDGIAFNAAMESNTLALSRLVGSGEEARAMVARLFEEAKRTPFEFSELTTAARRMIAFGLSAEQTERTLRALGDAVAAAGGGSEQIQRVSTALGQIQAKGKVSAEELLQLTEAGIPAYRILKDELGLTGEQVANIGNEGIKSERAIAALTRGMEKDFKGAAAAQATTFDGMMSTLRDNWAQTTGALTQGLFQELKRWTPEVNRTMEEVAAVWKRTDLSFEDKFRISRAIVDRNLGPAFDQIEAKLGQIDAGEVVGRALNAAIPVVAQAAGTLAVEAAKSFARAFVEGEPMTRLVLGGWLLSKAGGFAAWRAYGVKAGAATAAGAAAGAAAGGAAGGVAAGAAGGWSARLLATAKSVGTRFGLIGAGAAAVAYGPEFAKQLNQKTDLDLPARTLGERVGNTLTIGLRGKLDAALLGAEQDAKLAGERMQKAFDRFAEAGDARGLVRLADQARDAARQFPTYGRQFEQFAASAQRAADAAGATGDEMSRSLRQGIDQVNTTLRRFSMTRWEGLDKLRQNVDANWQQIGQTFREGSQTAKNAAGRNIGEAVKLIDKAMDRGQLSTAKGMEEIRRLMSQKTGASARVTARNMDVAIASIRDAMRDGRVSTSRGMDQILEIVRKNMPAAARSMDHHSEAGRKALARNLTLAMDAVRDQMRRGEKATHAGMLEIHGYLKTYLTAYGAKLPGLSKNPRDVVPKKRAKGGYIGQAGQAGHDTVPIMAAPGEAVVNRHQAPHIDRALAVAHATGASPYGSMRELFARERRPNYMARGGFVQGASSRGLTGPAMAMAQKLFARGFNVTSAFRSSSNTYHGRGGALDFGNSVNDMARLGRILIPMRAQLAELFGPGGSWKHGKRIPQVPGHMDHWHLAVTGGTGALGAAFEQIKRVKIRGDLGVVSQIGQGAVDQVRKAANDYLEQQAMTVDGGHGAGQAAGPRRVRQWASTALRHVNWFSPANLNALVSRIMQESGGNPRAVNNWDINAKRGDPSKGLAQTIGATFQAYRDRRLPNDVFHPIANLVAALRYMRSRYGRVVGANGQGYAKGGFVEAPFVGSYKEGGPITRDGFAYVHKGEHVIPRMQEGGIVASAAARKKRRRRSYVDRYGGMGPGRLVRELTTLPSGADTRSQRAMDALEDVLDNAKRVAAGHLERLAKDLRARLARIRKGGITARERPRMERFKEALDHVEEEVARRLGLIGESVQRSMQMVDVRRERLALDLRTRGVDAASAEGLRATGDLMAQQRKVLVAQAQRLARAIRRARREGKDEDERELVDQLRQVQTAHREMKADLAENTRALLDAAIEGARAAAEHGIGAADIRVREMELAQRYQGTADTPEAMRARAGMIQSTVLPSLQARVNQLWQARAQLAGAGRHQEAAGMWLEARRAELEVMSAHADAAELLRQAAEAAKRAQEENLAAQRDLLKEQLKAERDRRRLAEAQFPVFAGLASLAQARLVGRFPHGAEHVRVGGLAEIHRGETIIPDPEGAYQIRARQMTKPGPPPEVRVIVEGDAAPFIGRVRAEIDGRAARVVSEQLGKRSRQIAGAPGRRG